MNKLVYAYFEVTKPKIWILLAFTAFGGFVVASGKEMSWITGIVMLLAVILGSAGANTLTNYIDRDIDAVMNRTKLRPLPTHRISPASRALIFGLVLSVVSLLLAASLLNFLSFIFLLLGIFDNVIIYSRIMKRRSPLNIIMGGFSGGMPVLIGYVAVTNEVTIFSLLLAAIVVIWTPAHIWSLALHSKEDYAKVNVPMLPVVVKERTAVRIIAIASILMVVFSLVIPLYYPLGLIYFISAAILGVAMLVLNLWLFLKPTKEVSWIVFKASSPYLGLIFTALILDALI
jgi:protoheme IX farnesyltransferase